MVNMSESMYCNGHNIHNEIAVAPTLISIEEFKKCSKRQVTKWFQIFTYVVVFCAITTYVYLYNTNSHATSVACIDSLYILTSGQHVSCSDTRSHLQIIERNFTYSNSNIAVLCKCNVSSVKGK